MNKPPIHITKHLAYSVVGRGFVSQPYSTSVEILSGSSSSEEGYTPAESVHIMTIEGVRALRDLCDETIKAFEENNPSPAKA